MIRTKLAGTSIKIKRLRILLTIGGNGQITVRFPTMKDTDRQANQSKHTIPRPQTGDSHSTLSC